MIDSDVVSYFQGEINNYMTWVGTISTIVVVAVTGINIGVFTSLFKVKVEEIKKDQNNQKADYDKRLNELKLEFEKEHTKYNEIFKNVQKNQKDEFELKLTAQRDEFEKIIQKERLISLYYFKMNLSMATMLAINSKTGVIAFYSDLNDIAISISKIDGDNSFITRTKEFKEIISDLKITD